MEPVLFPDVEDVVIQYLRTKLPGVRVSTVYGGGEPEVRVTRSGGVPMSLVHDAAQVIFECWGDYANAANARAHVQALDEGNVWYGGEIGGLAYFPDPATDRPRYQFTALIRSHGEAI